MIIYHTPLFIAVECNNIEIVNLLLACPNVDVNFVSVFI